MRDRFVLSDDIVYSLYTETGLWVHPSETLEQHGFGNLFTARKGMALRMAERKRSRMTSRMSSKPVDIAPQDSEQIVVRDWKMSQSKTERHRSSNALRARIPSEKDCSEIVYDIIEEAYARACQLEMLNNSLHGLTDSQLSSVTNFIASLSTHDKSLSTYDKSLEESISSIGPIFHRTWLVQ